MKKGNLYKDAAIRYTRCRILEFFGINFTDFLNLPIDRYDELFEVAEEIIRVEDETRRRVEANEEKAFANLEGQ